MATWTIASTFDVQVGTVTASDIVVGYLAGADFTNDGSVDGYLNSLRLNLTPSGTPEIGTLFWDTDHSCPAIKMNADVTAQIPLENLTLVVNKTGVTISDGEVVYISGAQGNRPTIALAQSDALATSQIIGVVTQDIANNAEGFVTISGEVHEYDTSGFTAGDALYLSAVTPGLITNVAPTSPNFLVHIGTALNSTAAGKIHVAPEYPIALNTSLGTSDLVTPSQKAVKIYVDAKKFVDSIAVSDESTDLTTGTLGTFRIAVPMTLTDVRASVTTAPVGSTIIVDILEGGVSILSTAITIDAGEKTSTTAAIPPVISDSALADDSEVTISVTQVGSVTAGAGLKIYLIGTI